MDDAAAEPGAFSPLCDFDATLVLSQSQALAGIAWYNVPASDTAQIPLADMHMIVPPGTPLNTVVSAEDIRTDPAYEGGFIGFALMKDFKVAVLVGFIDYIRKLADVARAEGVLDQIHIRMISGHLGTEDRASVEQAWGGAKAFDWYGVGDTGAIAGEGPERDGLYVWEDAQYLELLDVDNGTPVGRGATGDMVVTTCRARRSLGCGSEKNEAHLGGGGPLG